MRAAGTIIAALVAGGLAVLTGCSAPPARLPQGVSVDVKQYRDDYAKKRIELRVSTQATGLTVTGLTLNDPSLASVARWRGTRVFDDHRTIDLAVALPPPRCSNPPQPRVTLRFVLEDGRAGRATIDATQSLGDLDRIQGLGCAVDRVDAIAPLVGSSLAIEGSGRASVAALRVEATPTGGTGSYRVTEVQSTVLLGPEGGGQTGATAWPLLLAVSADGPPQSAELRIVPSRCDAHVIAENKVGTILKTHVTIDDGRAPAGDVVIDLPLAEGVSSELLRFVAAHCGIDG